MDKFGEYLFWLLNAPLKKLKDGVNQLKIFFEVVGEVFDGMLQDILKLRHQKMIDTAEPIILEVIGQDRDMFKLQGESTAQYRNRLQKKAIISELGGTNTGLLLAIGTLGYPECTIEPLYLTDRSRWAEIYIDILMVRDINYEAILYTVLKVKTARTLPYFRFRYPIQAQVIHSVAVGRFGSMVKVKAKVAKKIDSTMEHKACAALSYGQNLLIKADNEIKPDEVYILTDTGLKRRVTVNGMIIKIK